METLFISDYDSPAGKIYLGATFEGVCKVSFGDEAGFMDWLFDQVDAVEARRQDYYQIKRAKSALRLLFAGQEPAVRKLKLDLRGTAFQKKVWLALLDIPFGQTLTYGQLAEKIGSPKAARAVGQACGANPLPLLVPCHRVVGTNHRLGGYAGGSKLKEQLLKLEGSLLF